MITLQPYRPVLTFGLTVIAMYGAAALVAAEIVRGTQPAVLAAALTLDLTLIVPALYYGLLVRRKGWPSITVAPVFLLSLLIASLAIPADHQGLLHVLRYLAAPVEVLLLGSLGWTVVRTARRFQRHTAPDVLDRLRESLYPLLHARWAADVLAYETALFYYALFSWRMKPDDRIAKQDAFSYHKRSGYGGVLAGILVAMLIEMIALHAWLWTWQSVLAWPLTVLSLYGVLWLLGDWQAVRLRPIVVEEDALTIRIGLRWTMRVPFAAIASVHPMADPSPPRKQPGHVEAVLLGRPHYRITLKQPIMAQGLYGFRKKVTTIGFTVDMPDAFETVLQDRFAAWMQRHTSESC